MRHSSVMCVDGTPLHHHPDLGLWVKREDLCCPGGPDFSKTRGVFAHVKNRPERIIGVLDTHHSQGGWAVARACRLLDKHCVNFYPIRKAELFNGMKPQQQTAMKLGAEMVPLQAGRSAVLYHAAKKILSERRLGTRGPDPTYMMPNALKLPEMITETAAEVARTFPGQTAFLPGTVIVSASSGTIAAGVWRGLYLAGWRGNLIVHQGYSRSEKAIRSYMEQMIGPIQGDANSHRDITTIFVDEGYAYGDEAKAGPSPLFPCNRFYDLKAFRWWMREGRGKYNEALLWNIG